MQIQVHTGTYIESWFKGNPHNIIFEAHLCNHLQHVEFGFNWGIPLLFSKGGG